MYGPHTLAAYQQIYDDLATKLALNQPAPSGPPPYDMRGKTFSYVLPPTLDGMFIWINLFFFKSDFLFLFLL